MNVILIGYRGTGKSSVAKILADRLGYRLVCLDDLAVAKAGMSINALVKKFGWDRFRELEAEVVRAAAAGNSQVLDCGGGVILRADNRALLKKAGKVFWLQAEVASIENRLRDKDDRPSLTGASFLEEISKVLAEREPLYRETANYSVSTDRRPPAAVAAEILALLSQY